MIFFRDPPGLHTHTIEMHSDDLKHLQTKKSLNEGKISVGDLTILALFMASQYFKMENDFNSIVPSAVPIINNLTKNKKLAAQVENGKAVPFCPY